MMLPMTIVDETNERAPDVDVYWYWPEHNGGAPITNFRVEVTEDQRVAGCVS